MFQLRDPGFFLFHFNVILWRLKKEKKTVNHTGQVEGLKLDPQKQTLGSFIQRSSSLAQ